MNDGKMLIDVNIYVIYHLIKIYTNSNKSFSYRMTYDMLICICDMYVRRYFVCSTHNLINYIY